MNALAPRLMASFLRLTRALLVSFVRNRQGMFWTLLFPVILMGVFALLGNQGALRVAVAVAGPPGSVRAQVEAALRRLPIFTVSQVSSSSRARQEVAQGKVDVALVVPGPTGGEGPVDLVAYTNTANYLSAQEALSTLQLAVAELNQVDSHRPPAFILASRAVSGRHVTYLAFLLPGILALMAMQNALFGLSGSLVRWKERGVLRRMFATPLPPGVFLAASVGTQLIIGLVTFAILIFMGKEVLHVDVQVPLVPLFLTLALGSATFLAIAFFVAGLARTTEAVAPIVNLISFPMMFLSGIWFPVTSLPSLLQRIVSFLPLTYLAGATRSLMSNGPVITTAVRSDWVGLTVWLCVASLVAARTWRWE